MKPMSERKMDMRPGKPNSDGYFPEEAHRKELKRAGEIRGFKYPDTEEALIRDQDQGVRETSANMPKPGFRH